MAVATATVAVVALAAVVAWNVWPRGPRSQLAPEARVFYDKGVEYLREQSETARGVNTAIGFFNRALEQEPESALVLARLGEAYWLLYRRDSSPSARTEAETAVHNAFLNDPDLPEVRNTRALGWITEGLNLRFYFGGTSLLIIVGVAMDTVSQVEAQLVMRHYDGFTGKGGKRIRGRR